MEKWDESNSNAEIPPKLSLSLLSAFPKACSHRVLSENGRFPPAGKILGSLAEI